jgi:hypothetical protein
MSAYEIDIGMGSLNFTRTAQSPRLLVLQTSNTMNALRPQRLAMRSSEVNRKPA